MSVMPLRCIKNHQYVDPLTKYLKSLSPRKLQYLSARTGISVDVLSNIRDNPEKQIRYFDALKIVNCSNGEVCLRDLAERNVKDIEKYDSPLGRKIAAVLAQEGCQANILAKHGITHVELSRWMTENTRWSESTKAKIKEAFSRGKIQITDDDFEQQKVDRLRVAYEKARDEYEQKKAKR